MSSGIRLEMETNFKNHFSGPAPLYYENIPGFVIFFYDVSPIHGHCVVENPYRASWGDDQYFCGESTGDIDYWEGVKPIGKYVVTDVENWEDCFDFFSSPTELKEWLNNSYYEEENYEYAGLEELWPYGAEQDRVAILKSSYCPIIPEGACYAVLTYINADDLYFGETLPISFITNPTEYGPIRPFYGFCEDCRYDPNLPPGRQILSHKWIYQISDKTPEGEQAKCPHLMVYGVNEDRITTDHDVVYPQTYIYPDDTEMNNPHGPFLWKRLGKTVEGLPKTHPVPDEAHAPEHLDEVWPGVYEDGSPTWKQLCTKEELDPEHEGAWPEPSEGGQYSYTGPWDSHCLYVVGEDWDGAVKPYFSQISEDALHTWRRQIDGDQLFDHTARFIPPSTSRGWGAKTRCKFGLDTNKTPFGLERPNIMISQDGKYNLEAPEWALTDGYKKLIDDDLAEVSLPHTWGRPRNSQGERDWDCIYPASWYMLYKTMFFSNRTSYDLHNSLFVVCNQYPGERVLERNPDAEDLGLEPTITEWKWPEEEPREFGDEVVPKHDRLGLTNYPWIPCVLGIAASHYASVRTGKLPLLEEQENVYVDEASREDENPYWPADRTVTYCDEIDMMGIVFDAEFFQGTQPPTADSLHHAPDMSDFVTDSTWFNPSKVFGRTKTDRQFAYLPPCAFDMNFIIGGSTSTRVFYPTRKGVISATYTSKSKRVLQEVNDYYMAEGECVLSYVSPTRKAYTAERGDENSRNRATIVSAVYSSQSLVDSVCDQLETSAIAKVNYNWTVPFTFTTDITNYLIPGVANVLINLNSETIAISGKFRG